MKDMKQRISDTNPYGLRMPPDVRRKVEDLASEMDRSLNWTINDLLRQALKMKEQSS